MNYEEIAKQCGVHKSTVSRALRNSPKVNAKTREKILEVVRTSNYHPSPLVSAWMSHVRNPGKEVHSPVIAWINMETEKDLWHREKYLTRIHSGAQDHLQINHFSMDEFWLDGKEMNLRRLLRILEARGIQGVLLPYTNTKPLPEDLHLLTDAFNCINLGFPIEGMVNVGPDLVHNFDLAFNKAWEIGYRRIGFCAYPGHEVGNQHAFSARYLSFSSRLPRNLRIPIVYVEPRFDTFEPVFRKWFEKYRPEVVLCRNPLIFEFFDKHGIRVPDEVGIIHTNLNPLIPETSGIEENHRMIGSMAASLVINRMTQGYREFDHNVQIIVPGNWSPGKTTPESFRSEFA